MPLNTRTKWEYITLTGKHVAFMGADKLLENKGDTYSSERHAWDELEEQGWELVAVALDKAGELVHYFKRRQEE